MPNLVLLAVGIGFWTLASWEFRLGRILDRVEGEAQISRKDSHPRYWLALGFHILLGNILVALSALTEIPDSRFDFLF